jgi:hypothetical protein
MFEINGAADGTEKSLWQTYVLAFALGCFVTFLLFEFIVIPHAKRAAEKASQERFFADLARDPLEGQLASAKAALQSATQQRDECKARFDRQTILYDNTIPIDPGKMWIIPADVEPIAVGDHHVTYTHYDLKTKRETVHLYPRRQ